MIGKLDWPVMWLNEFMPAMSMDDNGAVSRCGSTLSTDPDIYTITLGNAGSYYTTPIKSKQFYVIKRKSDIIS